MADYPYPHFKVRDTDPSEKSSWQDLVIPDEAHFPMKPITRLRRSDELPAPDSIAYIKQLPDGEQTVRAVTKFGPPTPRVEMRVIADHDDPRPKFTYQREAIERFSKIAEGMGIPDRFLSVDGAHPSVREYFDHHVLISRDGVITRMAYDRRDAPRRSPTVQDKADQYIAHTEQPVDDSFLRQASKDIWASVLPKYDKT